MHCRHRRSSQPAFFSAAPREATTRPPGPAPARRIAKCRTAPARPSRSSACQAHPPPFACDHERLLIVHLPAVIWIGRDYWLRKDARVWRHSRLRGVLWTAGLHRCQAIKYPFMLTRAHESAIHLHTPGPQPREVAPGPRLPLVTIHIRSMQHLPPPLSPCAGLQQSRAPSL